MKALRPLSFDRGVLAVLAAFGVLLFAATFSVDTSTAAPTDIGPAFLPRVFSGALTLCSLLALFYAKPAEKAHGRLDGMVIALMVFVVAYAVALPVLGYVASTVIALAVVLTALRAASWWRIILFSLGMTAATYLVFAKLLGVGLPHGPWGF